MKAIITIILYDQDNVQVIAEGAPRDLGSMMDHAVQQNTNVRASVIVAAALMIKSKSVSMYRRFLHLLGLPAPLKTCKA